MGFFGNMVKIRNIPSGSTTSCISSGQDKKTRAPIAMKFPLVLGKARKRNCLKDNQITIKQFKNLSLLKILTKVPFLNRESNLSAGEELNTYSTMLTPRPPLSDRGDNIAFTSLFPWKPCPDLLCTIIGWDIEWSVWKKEHNYKFVLLS